MGDPVPGAAHLGHHGAMVMYAPVPIDAGGHGQQMGQRDLSVPRVTAFREFRDNVKAFYDYLIAQKYNEKYKIVVSINDVDNYVQNTPDNVTFVGNKQGISYFMRAKYAFYCFGKYPIKPSKSQVVVNLWHGTPLKKLGNLEKGLEKTD